MVSLSQVPDESGARRRADLKIVFGGSGRVAVSPRAAVNSALSLQLALLVITFADRLSETEPVCEVGVGGAGDSIKDGRRCRTGGVNRERDAALLRPVAGQVPPLERDRVSPIAKASEHVSAGEASGLRRQCRVSGSID